MKDKYYTVKEVAAITGYHPGSIQRFAYNGTISSVKRGDIEPGLRRKNERLIHEDQIEILIGPWNKVVD